MSAFSRWIVGAVVFAVGVSTVTAAELGRIDLRPHTVRVERSPVDAPLFTGWAAEGRLEFLSYAWDIGAVDFKQLSMAPQAGMSFAMTPIADLRINLSGASLRDDRFEVQDVSVRSDFVFVRPGAGVRLWANRNAVFPLYVDAQLNYYFINGKDFSTRSAAAGFSGGAGVGYTFDEGVTAMLGFVWETTFSDASVRANDENLKLSISAAGIGLGLNVLF